MKAIRLQDGKPEWLGTFIANIGESRQTFRYFDKRSVSVVNNHLATLLLMDQEIPVGYGHLEIENETVWLGICILPAYKGKGLGKLLMNHLLEEAKRLQIKYITLSVDNNNQSAIALYESFGFYVVNKFESRLLYELSVEE